MEPRDYTVVILYGYKPLKVSQHPTKFCGHKYCCSGDALVCQVVSQNQVII